MDPNIVLAFGVGVLLLYLVGRVLVVPLKYLAKLLINAVIGGILLWVLNIFGNFIGLHIPINPVTALTAGFLGIPGVVLLVVLQFILVK
ncbi:MAG: pro-sigmaK processing inhibitor BofA family protein [Bacillota bacterium]